ncbi:family 78 glycoside hydrolase catalytic domain [Pedobacter africanus]|uniref:alpha-L-rhamnosidase n=1 Tax=Pedobacter africanus TaxID=151894 RepID=A0A1W2AS08_9SPHI|nr:family 78 glycoside hydrolase catalytic domain [Pedobacter africanus]SMC63231.1 alpha-L-rhamnosidase [Pedobacter africanus]
MKINYRQFCYIKCLLPAVVLLVSAITAQAQALKAPTDLRVDLLLPVPVPLTANLQPHFTWVMNDIATNSYQAAYRILIASSLEKLDANRADIWDSGKVRAERRPTATYPDRKLMPNTTYYWKVMIWNNLSLLSPFSKAAVFRTSGTLSRYRTAFHPLIKSAQLPVNVKTLKDKNTLFDFGKAAFGQLSIRVVSAEGGDTLKIHIGEAADSTGRVERKPKGTIRYCLLSLPLKKGLHDYKLKFLADKRNTGANAIRMPEYIGEVMPFRYAEIETLPQGVTIAHLQRYMVSYPFNDEAALFKSSDTVLNQVWELSKYTIKATSFTGLYVDGDRERIPYEADALINQLSHYATDPEFSMAKRTLEYLIYHPTWPTEWSLQNLLIAWNDYLYSGDIRMVRALYPQLKPKLLTALARADGLISTRTGKQDTAFIRSIHFEKFNENAVLKDIVDWPQKGGFGLDKQAPGETDGFVFTDYNAVVNALHYQALVCMHHLAVALGEQKDAISFKMHAARVKSAFQRVFTDPDTGTIKDGEDTRHSSLHANMFALAFNLVPEKNKAAVLAHIQSRGMACSVYGAQFLLDGLYDQGEDHYALQLLTATHKRSWYNMIRSGATMTTEAWDIVYKNNQDWNHAWGAAPANIIVRKLMGVEPLSPAFETIQIKPQPGSLKTAALQLSTLKGKIMVEFNRDSSMFHLNTILPPNAIGIIYLPRKTANDRLFKNGKVFKAIQEGKFWKIPGVQSGTNSWKVEYF